MASPYTCNVVIDLEFTPVRSMAAGEFVEHRARVMEELHHESEACSVNLGAQCDGLADLLAKLRQQENNRAA